MALTLGTIPGPTGSAGVASSWTRTEADVTGLTPQAGDALFVVTTGRVSVGTAPALTPSGGLTLVDTVTGASGNQVRASVWRLDLTGSTFSVGLTAASGGFGALGVLVRPGSGETVAAAVTLGVDVDANTDLAATGAAPIALATGDTLVVASMATSTVSHTAGPTVTADNATLGAPTVLVNFSASGSGGYRIWHAQLAVTADSGPASTPSVAATYNTVSFGGAVAFLALHAVIPDAPVEGEVAGPLAVLAPPEGALSGAVRAAGVLAGTLGPPPAPAGTFVGDVSTVATIAGALAPLPDLGGAATGAVATTGATPGELPYLPELGGALAGALSLSAVRFTAETDRYEVTTGAMPGGAAAWSVLWWAKLVGDWPGIRVGWAASGTGGDYLGAGADASEGDALPAVFSTAGVLGAGDNALTLGQWYRLAVVALADGTVTLYWGEGATGTLHAINSGPTAVGLVSVDTLYLGGSHIPGAWLDGSLASVKHYAAALSEAEVEVELSSWTAIRTNDLVRHHRLQWPELTDYSGNGHALTAGATAPVLDPDGPPITGPGNRLAGALPPLPALDGATAGGTATDGALEGALLELPALEGGWSADVSSSGQLEGPLLELPALEGHLITPTPGEIVGQLEQLLELTGSWVGDLASTGALEGPLLELPALEGGWSADVSSSGQLEGPLLELPALEGGWSGAVVVDSEWIGALPALPPPGGRLGGAGVTEGDLPGALPALAPPGGAMLADVAAAAALVGTLAALVAVAGGLGGAVGGAGGLGGPLPALPRLAGRLDADMTTPGAVVGALPALPPPGGRIGGGAVLFGELVGALALLAALDGTVTGIGSGEGRWTVAAPTRAARWAAGGPARPRWAAGEPTRA